MEVGFELPVYQMSACMKMLHSLSHVLYWIKFALIFPQSIWLSCC